MVAVASSSLTVPSDLTHDRVVLHGAPAPSSPTPISTARTAPPHQRSHKCAELAIPEPMSADGSPRGGGGGAGGGGTSTPKSGRRRNSGRTVALGVALGVGDVSAEAEHLPDGLDNATADGSGGAADGPHTSFSPGPGRLRVFDSAGGDESMHTPEALRTGGGGRRLSRGVRSADSPSSLMVVRSSGGGGGGSAGRSLFADEPSDSLKPSLGGDFSGGAKSLVGPAVERWAVRSPPPPSQPPPQKKLSSPPHPSFVAE